MEALSKNLQPYKNVVGQAAGIVTIAQLFAGVFICKDIKVKGDTKGISSMPFVGGIVVALSMLKYGWILDDSVMLAVNYAALLLNIIYSVFYYYYTEDKWEDIVKPASIGTGLVGVLWGYTAIETPDLLEFRYGLIVTIMMLMLCGSPLMGIKEIVEKKDASGIPFVLTLMMTVVSAMWLLYGIIILNYFMVIQNIIGFLLCGVQLCLLFLYPGKMDIKKKSKKHK